MASTVRFWLEQNLPNESTATYHLLLFGAIISKRYHAQIRIGKFKNSRLLDQFIGVHKKRSLGQIFMKEKVRDLTISVDTTDPVLN